MSGAIIYLLSRSGVSGLRFRVWGFRVLGSGFRGLGLRILGFGGLGFASPLLRVWGGGHLWC